MMEGYDCVDWRDSSECCETQSRRSKAARFCYSSKMSTTSHQDPLPDYVDPELLKLIAQNAPFELDVFTRSLRKSKKGRADNGQVHRRAVKHEDERRPSAVGALLSSIMEGNEDLASHRGWREVRHSCPERIWSDYDEDEQEPLRAGRENVVERKRLKSLDADRILPIAFETQCRSPRAASARVAAERFFCSDECREAHTTDIAVSTPLSCEHGSSMETPVSCEQESSIVEDECLAPLKPKSFTRLPSPHPEPEPLAACNNHRVTDEKPWRHGMRKGQRSTENMAPESARCKRKAEADSLKNVEKPALLDNYIQVRKYMETKQTGRREEQKQLKAAAAAALEARKEQQRKLDSHRQTLFQLQLNSAKHRGHTPRPAWVSDCNIFGEPARPWSSSSSSELNVYLPPPVTPPKLEPVPLDLYTTRFQCTQQQSPTSPGASGNGARNRESGVRRRSKKGKGSSRDIQRQIMGRKSDIFKAIRENDAEFSELANAPVIKKARWKARTKPMGRKLSSEQVSQLQLAEHEHTPFQTEKCPTPDSKCHSRLPSKLKRLKRSQPYDASEPNEFTAKELATMLNANRRLSDCESETHTNGCGNVITQRMIIKTRQYPPAREAEMITDLRKCVGHSLGSSKKRVVNEDVHLNWFRPSLCNTEKILAHENVPLQSAGRLFSTSPRFSLNKVILQEIEVTNEKTGLPLSDKQGNSRDPTSLARHERMLLLKNLADQLVKRVDAACAKKRQLQNSTVEHSKTLSVDSHFINRTQPFLSELAAGSTANGFESSEPDLNFPHQLKPFTTEASIPQPGKVKEDRSLDPSVPFSCLLNQNKFLHGGGLTEQEQAGCGLCSVQDEMGVVFKPGISTSRKGMSQKVAECTLPPLSPPISEICTSMDWIPTEKAMDITSKISSPSSSLGPSSPSTGSSSPVILPTSTKYHMGRMKQSKLVLKEGHSRKCKKPDTLQGEKDRHSIINFYAQGWNLIEKEILQAGVDPHDNRRGLEDTTVPKIDDPKESPSKFYPSSKFPFELLDPKDTQTVQSLHSSHRERGSSDIDVGDLDSQSRQNTCSYSGERRQNMGQETERSGTSSTHHPKAQVDNVMLSGHTMPGVMLMEIGDLTLCHSPTSFHLRLDRQIDNHEANKWGENKQVTSSSPSKITNLPASSSICRGTENDTGKQNVKNLTTPLKITYARRSSSGTLPDGGFTADDSLVVELHPANAEGGVPLVQGAPRILGPKSLAITETPTSLSQSNALENAESNYGTRIVPGTSADKDIRDTHIPVPNLGNRMQDLITPNDSTASSIRCQTDLRTLHVSSLNSTCSSNERGTTERNKIGNSLLDLSDKQLSKKTIGNKMEVSKAIRKLETDKKLNNEVHLTVHEQGIRSPRMKMTPNHVKDVVFDRDTDSRGTDSLGRKDCAAEEAGLFVTSVNDPEFDPSIDVQNPEEWQLKLRRNELEAELQRIDAEIKKTRVRLQQSCSAMDNQAQSESATKRSESLPNPRYVHNELSKETSITGKVPANHMLPSYNLTDEGRFDAHLQIMPFSPLSPRSCTVGERKISISNSHSESSQSALAKTRQTMDRNDKNNVAGQILKDQPDCVILSSEQAVDSTESAKSNGRPARKSRQRQESSDEIVLGTSLATNSPSTLMVDQIFDNKAGGVLLFERNDMADVKSSTVANPDTRLDAHQDSTDIPMPDDPKLCEQWDTVPQRMSELATIGNTGPKSFQNVRRIQEESTHEVVDSSPYLQSGQVEVKSPTSTVGECDRAAFQRHNSSGRTLWHQTEKMIVMPEIDIKAAHIASPCLHDNSGPVKLGEDCALPHHPVDALQSFRDEKLVDESACAVSNRSPFDVQCPQTSKGIVEESSALTSESQEKVEDITSRSIMGACSRSRQPFLSVEHKFANAAVEVLPSEMDEIRSGETVCGLEWIPPSSEDTSSKEEQKIAEDAIMDSRTQTPSQQHVSPSKKASDQMETAQVRTCSGDGQNRDSSRAPQMCHGAVLTSSSLPEESISNETDWESLSSPAHMDFSTIKKKLRNNKLASDHPSIPNNWNNLQYVHPSSLISTAIKDSCDKPALARIESPEPPTAMSADPSETLPSKEMPLLKSLPAALSEVRPKNKTADEDSNPSNSEGLPRLALSSRAAPAFLSPMYFNAQRMHFNHSEEVESTVSEELEHYESDIDEVLEANIETPSVDTQYNLKSSCATIGFDHPSSDVESSLPTWSPKPTVFQKEPVHRITAGLVSGMGHIQSNSLDDDATEDSDIGGLPLKLPGHNFGILPWKSECQSPQAGNMEFFGSLRAESSIEESMADINSHSQTSASESMMAISHPLSDATCDDLMTVSRSSSGQLGIACTGQLPSKIVSTSSEYFDLPNFDNNQEICDFEATVPDIPLHTANVENSGSTEFAERREHLMEPSDANSSVALSGRSSTCEDNSFEEMVRNGEISTCFTTAECSSYLESDNLEVTESPCKTVNQEATALRVPSSTPEEATKQEFDHGENNESCVLGVSVDLTVDTRTTIKSTILNKPSDPEKFCFLDVNRVEITQHSSKTLDINIGPTGLAQNYDVTEEVDTKSEDVFVEMQKSVSVFSGTCSSSNDNATVNRSDRKGHGSWILRSPDEGVSQLHSAVPVHESFRSARADLAQVPLAGKDMRAVSNDLEMAFPASQEVDAVENSVLPAGSQAETHHRNQLPVGGRISDTSSPGTVSTLDTDESIVGPPSIAGSKVNLVPTNIPHAESDNNGKSEHMSYLRPDQIIDLQSCTSTGVQRRSSVLNYQEKVVDLDSSVCSHADDEKGIKKLDHRLELRKAETEYEGQMGPTSTSKPNLLSPPSRSLQLPPIVKLPSQQVSLCEIRGNSCSNKKFLLEVPLLSSKKIAVAPESPVGEKIEAMRSNLTHSSGRKSERKYPSVCEQESGGSKYCETVEDVSILHTKKVSSSKAAPEHKSSPSFFTVNQDNCCSVENTGGPLCLIDGIFKTKRMEGAKKADKQNFMADTVTEMLFKDLLSKELSGLHYDGDKRLSYQNTSLQNSQTLPDTKPLKQFLKRKSKNDFEFCVVLKHFLPIGWRCASVRHKTGSFLHVEGLKLHPLSSATRFKPKSGVTNLTSSGDKLQDEPDHSLHHIGARNTQSTVILDLNDVHVYVHNALELSSLILDPSPSNWYDSNTPVGEHIFSAAENQVWKTGGAVDQCQKMHNRLVSDLINESLLKKFATLQCVPSLNVKTIPLPAGGDNLVQFITDDIVANESYALKHRFDIEKVVGKDLEDDRWENCSEEARDVVCELANAIFCDLIQSFVIDMVKCKNNDSVSINTRCLLPYWLH